MPHEFTDAELEAYLDEALDPNRAAQLEITVRKNKDLLHRLSHINGRRDAGIHTLGEIWRRNQIGVPSTEQMSNYLLGVLDPEEADYIDFRIDILKCPYTVAMIKDLQERTKGDADTFKDRRSKYFKSSAGLLRRSDED